MVVRSVWLREVGLRDGLQMVSAILPAEAKIAWVKAAAAAGVAEVEITSFVPAQRYPQYADAAAVVEATRGLDRVVLSALVPNAKGARRALDTGISKINYVVSASNGHSIANVGRSTAEAVDDFRRVVDERERCDEGGKRTILSCGIATAFGCSIQGEVDTDMVLETAVSLVEAGADELLIADTVGYAGPRQVAALFTRLRAIFPDVPIGGHFHDTRGLGLANVAAAAQAGIRWFDASIGGLGGCPQAPGASGNVAFEDCAFLLEKLDLPTGIDFSRLLALRREIEAWLPDQRWFGTLLRAGLPKAFQAGD